MAKTETDSSVTTARRRIRRAAGVALLLGGAAVAAAWLWLPPRWVAVPAGADVGERLGYALRVDLPVFLWLLGCVQAVSTGRYRSDADIRGSASSPPSPKIAVRAAVLQNSLEQTVVFVGAQLALASLLAGDELVLLPVLTGVWLVGRIAFAIGYARDPIGRAFGMVLTVLPSLVAMGTAAGLVLAGR